MANVLGELFGEIAEAIRGKTGDSGKMKPAEFPQKISAIKTAPVLAPLEITENGTYTAPAGVDGYNPVTVAVKPVLQDKTITENGEYTADSGFDGLGKVTVEVASSGGGGSLPAGAYWQEDELSLPNFYQQIMFMNNGVLHCATWTQYKYSSTAGYHLYRKENDAWVQLANAASGSCNFIECACTVELNGKTYFSGNSNEFYVYDGSGSITKKTNLPYSVENKSYCMFVQDGKLKYFPYSQDTIYVYDEDSDTWTAEAMKLIGSSEYTANVVSNGTDVYFTWYKNSTLGTVIYRYENGKLTEVASIGTRFYVRTNKLFDGKYLYGQVYNSAKKYDALAKLNIETGEFVSLGRYPAFVSSSYVWLRALDCIRYHGTPANSSYSASAANFNLILHEVTE